MIDFTIETEIERPLSEVFAYATDPAKLASWQTNTVSAEIEGEGPFGLGTRLREVHRGPRGKELPSLVEVSEFEPGRAFALEVIEGPLPFDGRLTFEPTVTGTRVAFNVHGQPAGPMRLLTPLLRIGLKRQFGEHLANLKRVLEEGSPR